MTIRNRLTWLFTGLVAVILLGALSAAFLSQAQYTHAEFHRRLRDRAEVTAYVFLEQDELHESAFRTFQNRYLQVLSGEILQIYDASHQVRFVEQDARLTLPDALLARILTEKEVFFDVGPRQAVGILYRDNQGEYIVVAAAQNRAGQARLLHLAEMLGLVFVGSLVVIYVAGRVFAGRALAPIAAVNDQVDRITAEDLHRRVDEGLLPRSEQDELTRLARTFNRMLERLEASFEGQRTFVSNASHELRTPLTATIGEIQVLLARDRPAEAYREGLASVLNELQQLKLLINNLLELSQTSIGAYSTDDIRLDELLWEVREAVPPTQRHRVKIQLDELPADAELLELRGNRQLLGRALTNLVDNALKYSGELPVLLRFRYEAGRRRIQVQDQGIGIEEKALTNIFQPFFRADNARHISGHGMGLALATKIIELHGGTLRITSTLGHGTLAEVEL